MDNELILAICDFVEVLDSHEVNYLIGGSFASSLHGIFRTTNDVDILLDLSKFSSSVVAALEKKFLVDSEALTRNLGVGRAFNIFHTASAIKFDLFGAKTSFHDSELNRGILVSLPFAPRSFRVASAEDIVVAKLIWNKKSRSTRQTQDIIGVFHASLTTLDWEYIKKWAVLSDVLLELDEIKTEFEKENSSSE